MKKTIIDSLGLAAVLLALVAFQPGLALAQDDADEDKKEEKKTEDEEADEAEPEEEAETEEEAKTEEEAETEEKAEPEETEPEEAEPEEEAETEEKDDEEFEEPEEVEEEDDVVAAIGEDEEVPEAEEEVVEAKPEPEPKFLQGTWTKQIIFATEDGSFKFNPRGWVQPRFSLNLNPDADDVTEGSGFSLKRARFGFQAWLFDWAHFYLDTGWNSGSGKLIDYFADIDPWKGVAVLRVGHFRPYFSRQLLMATTKLAMVEYAQAWQDKTLGLNLQRDLGAGIHGFFLNGLEYGVGIWNGDRTEDGKALFTTAGRTTDGDTTIIGNVDFEFGGRIAVHPLSLAKVGRPVKIGDESDPEGCKKPGLSIGGSAYYNRRHDRIVMNGEIEQPYYDNQLKVGADLAFKWSGLSFQAEFFLLRTTVYGDTDPAVENIVEAIDDTVAQNLIGSGIGTYAQIGYFVMPGELEIMGRFDMVDEDTEMRGLRFYPALGGTYYFFGHNLKAQLMYRLRAESGYGELPDGTPDPGSIPTSHDIFLMFQASI